MHSVLSAPATCQTPNVKYPRAETTYSKAYLEFVLFCALAHEGLQIDWPELVRLED